MRITIKRNFKDLAKIELLTKDDMREAGLLARERILSRTAKGQDYQGRDFRPYTTQYVDRKRKELGASGRVDLIVSGEMLGNLTITNVTKRSVELGWTR